MIQSHTITEPYEINLSPLLDWFYSPSGGDRCLVVGDSAENLTPRFHLGFVPQAPFDLNVSKVLLCVFEAITHEAKGNTDDLRNPLLQAKTKKLIAKILLEVKSVFTGDSHAKQSLLSLVRFYENLHHQDYVAAIASIDRTVAELNNNLG